MLAVIRCREIPASRSVRRYLVARHIVVPHSRRTKTMHSRTNQSLLSPRTPNGSAYDSKQKQRGASYLTSRTLAGLVLLSLVVWALVAYTEIGKKYGSLGNEDLQLVEWRNLAAGSRLPKGLTFKCPPEAEYGNISISINSRPSNLISLSGSTRRRPLARVLLDASVLQGRRDLCRNRCLSGKEVVQLVLAREVSRLDWSSCRR